LFIIYLFVDPFRRDLREREREREIEIEGSFISKAYLNYIVVVDSFDFSVPSWLYEIEMPLVQVEYLIKILMSLF
jgi:hypothetical protein